MSNNSSLIRKSNWFLPLGLFDKKSTDKQAVNLVDLIDQQLIVTGLINNDPCCANYSPAFNRDLATITTNTAAVNQVNVTGEISVAALNSGIITSTSAAAVTATLPTATAFATQIGAVRGSYFDFVVDNSLGASTVTLAVNTGITVGTVVITGGGTLTVSTANVIGWFRLFFTSPTTAILRRIA